MKETAIYQILEIPSTLAPENRAAAGGNVLAAATEDCKHLLRTWANMASKSATLGIRFVFEPKSGDQQSRLRIFIMARYRGKRLHDALRLLLEKGSLTRFYKLKPIDRLEVPWGKVKEGCEILRREDAIDPLHHELNVLIPSFYYAIRLFEANQNNDYVNLDRVLAGLKEPVIIDMRVEPADVSKELSEHTRYLARLQSINRTWDQDDESELRDYLEDTHSPSTRRQILKPLRKQDPLADEIFRSQQPLHESLREPHLRFHILVFAKSSAAAQLIGSTVAESAFEGGSYRLMASGNGTKLFDTAFQSAKRNQVSATPVHEFLFRGRDTTLYAPLAPLSHLATVEELSGVFRLPLASIRSPLCIRKNTDPPYEDPEGLIVMGYDHENPGVVRGTRIPVFAKHFFIAGTTGVWKTTAMLNMAIQFEQHGIPFLVIEPVNKTEYRAIKMLRNHDDPVARRLGEKFEVYTPGNEAVSPFRLTPLDPQPGICFDEHLGNILSCFDGAMSAPGPLRPLWGEALEQVYEDFADKKEPPIMADLVRAAEKVLEKKGYSAETNSDIRAALDVRMGALTRRSLGKVFQCRHSIPAVEHLMKVPAVIELACLNREERCLLTLFLLTRISEYLKTVPKAGKTLRYIIIIEEAHNIVGCSDEARVSPDIADPKAFAAEYVCNMLAELRALGVGIIIVDQTPSVVAPEVIKNTTTKLIFRLQHEADRKVVGASMLMGSLAMEELGYLNPGEAFLFTEGYREPRRIRMGV